MNYALQDDDRFDEVGPAEQVLWCLRRLEPDYVREVPSWLQYVEIEHDRLDLSDAMLISKSNWMTTGLRRKAISLKKTLTL